jgi:hypothetical protein
VHYGCDIYLAFRDVLHITFLRLVRLEANNEEEIMHNKFWWKTRVKINVGNINKEV